MEYFAAVLWYLRTYLWLVLTSPLLLPLFRRWPTPTLLAPLTGTRFPPAEASSIIARR
ncbi:hypothetical protein KMT30_01160 [Streptomyces sp. IBSBF 2953]|nr:hypothetical protein SHL15_6173 [Streptomyces hygroscopicus subsp. limoneus]MCQ9177682.1 hypothetical protein [Streptomyces hayashii]